jgi:putative tryptophan/tyrosine transport system substrate-binding protein
MTMTMTPTRREALLLPAKALLLGSLGMSGLGMSSLSSALAQTFEAPSANLPYWSWFKYSTQVTDKWVVEASAGDPNRVTILPKRIGDAGPRQKMIVIYPRPSSAYDIAISKILSVFDDKLLNVEVTVVNFLNNDQRGMELIKAAEASKYDLMLAMGSETTAWLWDNYKNGRIPVVSVCSKDPFVLGQSPGYNRGSGTNFAFTSLNMPIDVQMAYVSELKPKLRNIAVLVDSRNISAIETQAKPVITYAKAKGIRVIELSVQNPDNAKAELERMVKDATAQMMKNDPQLGDSIFWVTGSTSVFREIATINAHAGRAAVISVVPEIVRGGDDSAVLSIGISFESNAHIAAVFAADVIRGRAKAGELKVGLVSPPDIAISFRKIREIAMTIPLSFFEAAGTIYDYDGKLIRIDGVSVTPATN